MYYLIAFYQLTVELWCHAKNYPNAHRIKIKLKGSYNSQSNWLVETTMGLDLCFMVTYLYVYKHLQVNLAI